MGATVKDSKYHGTEGPLSISSFDPSSQKSMTCNETTRHWVKAATEIGIPYNHDYNGAEQV